MKLLFFFCSETSQKRLPKGTRSHAGKRSALGREPIHPSCSGYAGLKFWRFAEQMAGVENPLSANPSAAPPAPVRGHYCGSSRQTGAGAVIGIENINAYKYLKSWQSRWQSTMTVLG